MLLVAPGTAVAQDAEERQTVTVGVFVVNLSDLDLKTGSYFADFYIWFRWRGKFDPSTFEIMNGRDTVKERNDYLEARGIKYAAYRCQSRFYRSFDLAAYPLDAHLLTIEIEDADDDTRTLIYLPDARDSKLEPSVTISGWDIGRPRSMVRPWVYPTSYGDPDAPADYQAEYSRFIFEIPIRHAGIGIYLKSFLPLFIAVAIAFLSVLIVPKELEARLAMGVAGIFGAVASQVVVAQTLPETPHFTLADRLHIVSMFFIFISILVSCLSYRLADRGNDKGAARLDRRAGILMPALFISLVVLFSIMR